MPLRLLTAVTAALLITPAHVVLPGSTGALSGAPSLPNTATATATTSAAASAAAAATRSEGTPFRWRWPLNPRPLVVNRFEVGPYRWSPGHRGVDLAAPAGAPVLAPGPGVVRFAGVVAGRPVVSVTHPDGLISSFEPVVAGLRPGARLQAGQQLGRTIALGSHCPRGCLHWGVRRGQTYLDPLVLLGAQLRPVALKPLGIHCAIPTACRVSPGSAAATSR